MEDMTVEKALEWRDTIRQPTLIVNNIMLNEGMEIYQKRAIERLWELLEEEHPEYSDDYIVDFENKYDLQLTLPGFVLAKHVLLSYIDEEKYESYLHLLQLKYQEIKCKNDIIRELMNTPKKQLKKLLLEAQKNDDMEGMENVISYMRAELKARRIPNQIKRFIVMGYVKVVWSIQSKVIVHRLATNLKTSNTA